MTPTYPNIASAKQQKIADTYIFVADLPAVLEPQCLAKAVNINQLIQASKSEIQQPPAEFTRVHQLELRHLQLLSVTQEQQQLQPSLVTLNTLMDLCEGAKDWALALHFLVPRRWSQGVGMAKHQR